MKIAIHKNPDEKIHSGDWGVAWSHFCIEKNIDFDYINCLNPNIIENLKGYDILLWHFSGYSFQDMLFARSILYSAKKMGLKIFPDFDDAWHFDDKIAETYLLQSAAAPIPKSEILLSREYVRKWIQEVAQFPVVAKLRNGSGSHNVKLLNNKHELLQYSDTMFTVGFNSSPDVLYKSASNIKSVKSFEAFIKRAKRIPEFIRTLRRANEFPSEKKYVLLQEFIPNNGFDLKIVVVGDKLSFIGRSIRSGDFRASGGGALFYDRDLVTKNIIDSAFRTSDRLGFKCMGYDYVVEKESGHGLIVEISYGFSHVALIESGGHFNRDGDWIKEPLNAPEEVLQHILSACINN